MRALVITPYPPVIEPGRAIGAFRRLGLFVEATGRIASSLHVAYIAPAGIARRYAEDDGFDRTISTYWGRPVTASVVVAHERQKTFANHYLRGIVDAAEQPFTHRYAGPGPAEEIGRLADQADIVVVQMLRPLLALFRSGRKPRHLFFDIDDIDWLLRLRSAVQRPFYPGRLADALQAPALFLAARRGIAQSDMSFCCSAEDVARLKPIGLGDRIQVIPNAVSVPERVAPVPAAPTLLFIGSLGAPFNIEAVDRLVERIFPLIQAEVPEARLAIAGPGGEEIRSHANPPPGVTFTGFVPDLDALYAESRVVCCPLVRGSGTRIKLLEGGAHGRPMVSTRIGAEGLAFRDQQEILIEDEDAGFAAACVRLLRDDALAARLGEAARRVVVDGYAEPNIIDRLEAVMRAKVGAA